MAVSTTDAKRILTTDLAPPIRRVQDVARRRLSKVETQVARETFASKYAESFLDAAERGEPHPPKPDRKWHEDDEEPSDVWFWWDEPCWGELINALRSYSLEGQAVVLDRCLRRVLPDPQAVVRPTIQELHEAERLALREICRLCEEWLAPASEDKAHGTLDSIVERPQTTVRDVADNFGAVVDETRECPLNPNVDNAIAAVSRSPLRPTDVSAGMETEIGNGSKGTSDLISFDSLRRLAGVSLKTLQNAVAGWRKTGCQINDPCSYATVRPLLIKKWPKKTALFGEFDEVKRTLDAQE